MVEEVVGKAVPKQVSPRRPGDPPALVADPSCAQKVLDWKATRSLREIVSSAWNWMQRCENFAGSWFRFLDLHQRNLHAKKIELAGSSAGRRSSNGNRFR